MMKCGSVRRGRELSGLIRRPINWFTILFDQKDSVMIRFFACMRIKRERFGQEPGEAGFSSTIEHMISLSVLPNTISLTIFLILLMFLISLKTRKEHSG